MTMKLNEGTAPIQDEPKKHAYFTLDSLGPDAQIKILDDTPSPHPWHEVDFSGIEEKAFAAGLAMGKTGKMLGMMGLLYGMGSQKLKDMVFLDHEGSAGDALQAYELKYADMIKKYLDVPKLPRDPLAPKAWEAQLPQERELVTKGFRSKLCKAKPGARAKAKAGRKARRR